MIVGVLKNKISGGTKHFVKTKNTKPEHTKLKYARMKHIPQSIAAYFKRNEGFGMNELLGIAAALIIAAFVIIPGLRGLAASIMEKLENWWANTIVSKIFSTI